MGPGGQAEYRPDGDSGHGERSAFNPLEELADTPVWAWVFLAIRFTGLALVVPVIEEFFLRGFLMRYVMHPMWWQVPFGQVNRTAVIVGTASRCSCIRVNCSPHSCGSAWSRG